MLNINPNWKYYLNLASQAFPLKSNAELVKILKAYNGSNDIESSMAVNHDRFVFLSSSLWLFNFLLLFFNFREPQFFLWVSDIPVLNLR